MHNTNNSGTTGRVRRTLGFSGFLVVQTFNCQVNIKDFIESFCAGTISVGYWYLYAYLAALIMLPFLRDIAKQLDICKFRYLMILHFLFCTLMPFGIYIAYNLGINVELNGNFNVPFAVQNSIFYMLIGFYIDNRIEVYAFRKSDFIKWGIIIMLGVIATAVFTCHQGVKYGFSQNFFQCVDYLIAIFMFLFIKWIFKSNAPEWINIVGSITFGIYLMEPFFRIYIYRYVMKYIPQSIPTMLFSMLYSFIAMIIVGSMTYILKSIPGIRKLI